MKRTAKKLFVAAAIAAVSIQSVPTASACGKRGGRVSYAPVYGGYSRAASNYRTTLPVTPPIHNARPTFNPPLHQTVQPAAVAPPVSTASTVAAVRPRPRAQVALQTSAAPQPTGTAATAQSQPSSQTTATTSAVDAETSALAALASLAASQPSAATTPSTTPPPSAQPVAASAATPDHIGSFRATLPSNVTIELNLNGSGTFSWVVSNNGKTSQFSGQYRVTDGRLTLVRSNDLQKMAGKLTLGPNGFTFQLDGTNNAGLDFKKVA